MSAPDTTDGEADAASEPVTADVLVVGSGIAGCAAALAAARAGAEVLVVTKAERPEETSTDWAQGGIAVAREDPESLKQDVIEASAGTADPAAVDVLVESADAAVRDVLFETLEIPFDGVGGDRTTDPAAVDYRREAAHSDDRILHVDASTGTHILRPFLARLDDREGVTVVDDTAALELITHEGRVHGATVDRRIERAGSDGQEAYRAGDIVPAGQPVSAGTTILATGGIGACYARTTNPDSATGDGIAMAALAGADVADMAFVQFHPTAYVGSEARSASDRSGEAAEADPFLVSEAVRGEGALLRNGEGERFMPDVHPDAELAPRDVVARAVAAERERTGEVVLDVSPVDFVDRFPDLAEKCAARGVDPSDGIPVAPTEHFLCGGVAVDDRGRTSLDRLFAVGECACTGVHGANRLASTSLLEGLVWGLRAGETAARDVAAGAAPEAVEAPELLDRDPALPERFAAEKFTRLRRVMDEHVGIERTPEGLRRAAGVLRRLKGEVDAYVRTRTARDLYELRNAAVVALLVAKDAAAREESVGCHYLIGDDASESIATGDDPEPSAGELEADAPN